MGDYCFLKYQHRLRIRGRIHGKNGFGEKSGRVRLSRLSSRRIGEWYGARVFCINKCLARLEFG